MVVETTTTTLQLILNNMRFFCFSLYCFLNLNCNSQQDLKTQRLDLIHQSINLILSYDTSKLYQVVDTSAYFEIAEKEGFLSTVSFLKTKFNQCGTNIHNSAIKIENGLQNADNYITNFIVPFCRDQNGKVQETSFDFVVQFANYQNPDKIMLFKVKNYMNLDKLKPTQPSKE